MSARRERLAEVAAWVSLPVVALLVRAGTLRADTATFGVTLWTVVVVLGLLMFMPAAVLGPIAEYLALGR